jgi:hypothetical protein
MPSIYHLVGWHMDVSQWPFKGERPLASGSAFEGMAPGRTKPPLTHWYQSSSQEKIRLRIHPEAEFYFLKNRGYGISVTHARETRPRPGVEAGILCENMGRGVFSDRWPAGGRTSLAAGLSSAV